MYKIEEKFETLSKTLGERVGENYLRRRLSFQADHTQKDINQSNIELLGIEHTEPLMVFLYYAFKASQLYDIGFRNFLDIRVEHNTFHVHNLPPELDGYTILQLSDLHIDIDDALVDAIIQRVDGLKYDLCVVTGDYRYNTSGPADRALNLMGKLMPHLRQPVYAILGNHDFIEFVEPLEEMGMSFLINETVEIEYDGASFYLSGIDDPHYYEGDNFEKTTEDITEDIPKLLLAHCPSVFRHAEAAQYDIMLSGHTHGGQICLPGGIAVKVNSHAPRRMLAGKWNHKRLQGYTSRGTGSSGLPLRFFCPPEMTLHTLRSMP